MRRLTLVLALALGATGCATTAQPPLAPAAADLSGRWVGTWAGYGIVNIPRQEPASLEIQQHGNEGRGRLVMENTNAADSVPKTVRYSGLTGAPVTILVSGTDVTVTHQQGEAFFVADLSADGDRLTGFVRGTETPVRLALSRVKPPAPPVKSEAPAPPPAPQVAVAPPPPPPPPAPEPTPAAPVAPERPAPVTFGPVEALKTIHFAFDRADIRPAEAKVLDGNAEWLKSNRDTLLIIEGHCDERGTNEYNLALGERRARATRDYLIAQGVEAVRITTISYGEDRPLCSEHTEACWSQNRRADFKARPR